MTELNFFIFNYLKKKTSMGVSFYENYMPRYSEVYTNIQCIVNHILVLLPGTKLACCWAPGSERREYFHWFVWSKSRSLVLYIHKNQPTELNEYNQFYFRLNFGMVYFLRMNGISYQKWDNIRRIIPHTSD